MASAPSSPRLAAVAVALFVCPGIWGQSAGILKEVRFTASTEFTRIVLETSGEINFKYDRLQNPDRVYVDLIDTLPKRPPFKGLAYSIPVEDGIVRQIRVALNQKGVTRVVVDLEAPAEFKTSRLTDPDRVIVEFRRTAAVPAPEIVTETKLEPRKFVPPQQRPRKALTPLVIEVARIPRIAPPSRLPAVPAATVRQLKVTPAPNREAETAELNPPPEPTPPPARPAQPNRRGNYPLTRALGLKLNRVVLDAGHGGHDLGSSTKSGLVEKELVLDVSLRVGKLLEERMGTEVVYTRTDDTFVTLEGRTRIANDQKADLFLSIHANSSPYKTIAGTETYYLSFTNSQIDMEVATRENASSQKSIHELSDLVKKVMLNEKLDESREFASRIQSASFALATQTHGALRNRGVKKAPFVVLIGTTMPAVLTEIGFMSHPKEEALLQKDEHRQKIAEALYKGIVQYGRTLSHFAQTGTQERSRVSAAGKLTEGQ